MPFYPPYVATTVPFDAETADIAARADGSKDPQAFVISPKMGTPKVWQVKRNRDGTFENIATYATPRLLMEFAEGDRLSDIAVAGEGRGTSYRLSSLYILNQGALQVLPLTRSGSDFTAETPIDVVGADVLTAGAEGFDIRGKFNVDIMRLATGKDQSVVYVAVGTIIYKVMVAPNHVGTASVLAGAAGNGNFRLSDARTPMMLLQQFAGYESSETEFLVDNVQSPAAQYLFNQVNDIAVTDDGSMMYVSEGWSDAQYKGSACETESSDRKTFVEAHSLPPKLQSLLGCAFSLYRVDLANKNLIMLGSSQDLFPALQAPLNIASTDGGHTLIVQHERGMSAIDFTKYLCGRTGPPAKGRGMTWLGGDMGLKTDPQPESLCVPDGLLNFESRLLSFTSVTSNLVRGSPDFDKQASGRPTAGEVVDWSTSYMLPKGVDAVVVSSGIDDDRVTETASLIFFTEGNSMMVIEKRTLRPNYGEVGSLFKPFTSPEDRLPYKPAIKAIGTCSSMESAKLCLGFDGTGQLVGKCPCACACPMADYKTGSEQNSYWHSQNAHGTCGPPRDPTGMEARRTSCKQQAMMQYDTSRYGGYGSNARDHAKQKTWVDAFCKAYPKDCDDGMPTNYGEPSPFGWPQTDPPTTFEIDEPEYTEIDEPDYTDDGHDTPPSHLSGDIGGGFGGSGSSFGGSGFGGSGFGGSGFGGNLGGGSGGFGFNHMFKRK